MTPDSTPTAAPVTAPFHHSATRTERAAPKNDGPLGPFIPLLILCLVLATWFGFQATQLRAERDAMTDLRANQDKQIQEAKKLRESLDAIARGSAQLAASGNPNAKLIIDELKRRGITISDQAGQTGAAPAGPAK